MYPSFSATVATVLLLAAEPTIAQQYSFGSQFELPQFQPGVPLEVQIEQFQAQVLQYEREIAQQEALVVTPEQQAEVALYRQQFEEYQRAYEQQIVQFQQQFQQFLQPEQQGTGDDFQPITEYPVSGNILDDVLLNGTLASLSDDNIALFLSNEQAVASVAGCFASIETCYSKGAQKFVEELRALQPGTLCLECEPGEEERLNDVIYQLVSGLSTRYPDQWSVIFPQIFSTIVAFHQKVTQQQQQQ